MSAMLGHKVPCAECPWRKDAPQSWLGGHTPELYADAVAANEIPSCHNHDFGPDDHRSRLCVGALHTAANACILPGRTPNAIQARAIVGKSDKCFSHPATFYAHHAGKPYVSRFLRANTARAMEASNGK